MARKTTQPTPEASPSKSTTTSDLVLKKTVALGEGTRQQGTILGTRKDDVITWSKELRPREIKTLERNNHLY